jgi:hypothetical protein
MGVIGLSCKVLYIDRPDGESSLKRPPRRLTLMHKSAVMTVFYKYVILTYCTHNWDVKI